MEPSIGRAAIGSVTIAGMLGRWWRVFTSGAEMFALMVVALAVRVALVLVPLAFLLLLIWNET